MTEKEAIRLYLEVGFSPAFLQEKMNDVMYLKYARRQAEADPDKYPNPVPEVKADPFTKAFLYGYHEVRGRFERLRCMFGHDDFEKYKIQVLFADVVIQIYRNKSKADQIISKAVTRENLVKASNYEVFREVVSAAKKGDFLSALGIKCSQTPFASNEISKRERRLVASFIDLCREEHRLPTNKELIKRYKQNLEKDGQVLAADEEKDCRNLLRKKLGIILPRHSDKAVSILRGVQ